jgi:hypothetical protein
VNSVIECRRMCYNVVLFDKQGLILWKCDFQYIWKVERLNFTVGIWDYEMSTKYKTLTSSLFIYLFF